MTIMAGRHTGAEREGPPCSFIHDDDVAVELPAPNPMQKCKISFRR